MRKTQTYLRLLFISVIGLGAISTLQSGALAAGGAVGCDMGYEQCWQDCWDKYCSGTTCLGDNLPCVKGCEAQHDACKDAAAPKAPGDD